MRGLINSVFASGVCKTYFKYQVSAIKYITGPNLAGLLLVVRMQELAHEILSMRFLSH